MTSVVASAAELRRFLQDRMPDTILDFFSQHEIPSVHYRPERNVLERTDTIWNEVKIEFDSREVTGYLELIWDEDFGAKSWPPGYKRKFDPNFAIDWFGEMANQLTARTARLLESSGVILRIDVPKCDAFPNFGRPCNAQEFRLQFPIEISGSFCHAFVHFLAREAIELPRLSPTTQGSDVVMFR